MLKDDWEKVDAFETLSEDDARAMAAAADLGGGDVKTNPQRLDFRGALS